SLWGVETLIAGLILVFSLAEAITLQTPLYANLFLDHKELPDSMEAFSAMTLFFGVFVTIFLCSGVMFASMIYLGLRFYRSMYCDEGYLTHTLPVTQRELLTAKILTAVIWQVIVSFAVIVSIGIIAASAVLISLRNGTGIDEIVYEVRQAYEEIDNVGVVIHVLLTGVIYFFLTPVCTVVTLFGSISIGQLFKKHRGLMGIVVYFGIRFLTNLFGSVTRGIGNVLLFSGSSDLSKSLTSWMIFSVDLNFILSLAVCVALIIFTYVILKKKLNLQ
ncbi:MAG: hypothetical protein IK088_06605, partial [Lachnospiraceae bacterium]|nr:hypothetical protein [Lachnospiraceae bacterium]